MKDGWDVSLVPTKLGFRNPCYVTCLLAYSVLRSQRKEEVKHWDLHGERECGGARQGRHGTIVLETCWWEGPMEVSLPKLQQSTP